MTGQALRRPASCVLVRAVVCAVLNAARDGEKENCLSGQKLSFHFFPSPPAFSTFSAHTSLAFAGAGLTCVENQHFEFFGRVGSPVACASALALATTTGVFRVVSNRHWMSDVITGAGVGLIAGWLMPWLMHYRHDLSKREQSKMRHLYYIAPYGDPGSIGLSAAGAF